MGVGRPAEPRTGRLGRSTPNGITFGPYIPVTQPGSQARFDLQCADSVTAPTLPSTSREIHLLPTVAAIGRRVESPRRETIRLVGAAA